MQNLQLPHVNLPKEFVDLLKTNLSVTSSSDLIFQGLRENKAVCMILEKAFSEFDGGKGLEKTMMALGWSNFRDRVASVYIYKSIYGNYPKSTSMGLVEDIKNLEGLYGQHSVHSFSRLFLLGFYLKFANQEIQRRENNKYFEIKIPEEMAAFLRLSEGRSEKLDWLILILTHLQHALGEKLLLNYLMSGKKFDELYNLLTSEQKKTMTDNLLAYGASIGEPEMFIYDKI